MCRYILPHNEIFIKHVEYTGCLFTYLLCFHGNRRGLRWHADMRFRFGAYCWLAESKSRWFLQAALPCLHASIYTRCGLRDCLNKDFVALMEKGPAILLKLSLILSVYKNWHYTSIPTIFSISSPEKCSLNCIIWAEHSLLALSFEK